MVEQDILEKPVVSLIAGDTTIRGLLEAEDVIPPYNVVSAQVTDGELISLKVETPDEQITLISTSEGFTIARQPLEL